MAHAFDPKPIPPLRVYVLEESLLAKVFRWLKLKGKKEIVLRYNLDALERHPILSEKTVLKLMSHKEFLEREREGISRRIERIEKILSR